jgi:hypothetical protein
MCVPKTFMEILLCITWLPHCRALQLLRDMEGGEEAYNNSKNRTGLTPRFLWESNNEA